jgi:hypothetical protein
MRYGERLVETLARHQGQSETVLNLLKRPYRRKDRSLVLWLEPQLVELAGEMQIQAAIPRLMKRAKQSEEVLIDSAFQALSRIGVETVVRAIAKEWWDDDQDHPLLVRLHVGGHQGAGIAARRVDSGRFCRVAFTLTDWDYLGGGISFEAEETKDRKRQNRLNCLFAKIEELLATYTSDQD